MGNGKWKSHVYCHCSGKPTTFADPSSVVMPVRRESILRSDRPFDDHEPMSTRLSTPRSFVMDNNQSNYNVTAGSSSSLVDGDRVQVPVQKTPSEAGAALDLDAPSSGLRRRQYVDRLSTQRTFEPTAVCRIIVPNKATQVRTTRRFFCSSAACFLYTLHTTTFSTSIVGFGKEHPFVR
jgi:hypothetical protein